MKTRRQRPIKGGRERLPAAVEKRIWNEVDRQAHKFNCSRAFVVSTALADTLGIDLDKQDRYDSLRILTRKRA